uniref:Uncharacterized protein n=2 Tax=Oryza glumipatula TaxID=40148 RepID=A0A0E0AQN8_9ORYZ
MAGAAASPSRCKTMVAPSPFPRPLSAGWRKRHLIPRPRPLAAGTVSGVAGTGSSPLRPGDLTICYHAFYSSPACLLALIPYLLFYSSAEAISRHNLVADIILLIAIMSTKHLCPSPIACYDGPLDAMAACVVHAGGSDGGIQAHIKACAALGAICSSVVTAHNTIVVQLIFYETNLRVFRAQYRQIIVPILRSFSLLSGGSSIILRIILPYGVSVTLKPWLPERIKATGTSEL